MENNDKLDRQADPHKQHGTWVVNRLWTPNNRTHNVSSALSAAVVWCLSSEGENFAGNVSSGQWEWDCICVINRNGCGQFYSTVLPQLHSGCGGSAVSGVTNCLQFIPLGLIPTHSISTCLCLVK